MRDNKSVSNKILNAVILIAVIFIVTFVLFFSFSCEIGLIPHYCSGEDCLFCLICSLAKRTIGQICAVVTGSVLFAALYVLASLLFRRKSMIQKENPILLRVKLSC